MSGFIWWIRSGTLVEVKYAGVFSTVSWSGRAKGIWVRYQGKPFWKWLSQSKKCTSFSAAATALWRLSISMSARVPPFLTPMMRIWGSCWRVPLGGACGPCVVGGQLGWAGQWRQSPCQALGRPGGNGRGLHCKQEQPEEQGSHEESPDPGGFQPGKSSETLFHIERAAARELRSS